MQTVRIEDVKGVGLLEAALEQAYQDGYDDGTDHRSPRALDVTTDPQHLWEELMQLIGVTV